MSDNTGIDLTNLKTKRITFSVGGLILVAGGLWGAHEYTSAHLNDIFMPIAAAEELADKVDQALARSEENSERLVTFINRQELKEARQQLKDLLGQLQETLLWESANEENSISRARKRDLETDIDSQESYIICLEAGRRNCDL